ncbi:hypothetical protein BC832DRAFT_50798 [Gaertneriomyces semiglobifer]|nr:hypothetical protein BC832DRAFT_50798 [Gaertneriomyces semiglobifer]
MNDGTGNDMDMNYVDAVMNVNLDMNDPFLASLDPKTARLASELDFPLSGLTGLGPNAVSTEDFDLSNFLSLPSHYPSHASTTSSDATFSQQQQQLQPQQQQYPRSPFDQPLTPESSDAGPSSRSNSTLGSSMVFDPAHCPTNAEELKHYKPMGPGGTVYNKLVLEPVSLAAAPSIQKVVYQLCAHAFDNTSVPRPLSAFDDLPPLPDAYILNELIAVYFERLPPIIPIVHEAAFYRSASEPVTPDSYTDIRPKPPFHHNPPRRGLSPALLYSMFSCAARYHPYYQGQTELVEKTFYERARRLAAASFDNPNLNLLKTFLHLTLYTVEHSMWMPSYMMLGNGVMMARYLGLYKELPSIPVQPQPLPGQQPDEELLDGLSPNEVAAEECRRCWWWVRNYDASGSAASKRPQMISDSEYASTLLLPCPDSLFYAGRYGLRPNAPSVPRTLTLDEFFSPAFSAHVAYSNIGPNGYIACLTALFNRVTHFRQTCKTMNILPFAPGNDMRGQQVFVEIREHQQQLGM